ncbi:type II secretion system F family protein [Patescibacteria group bacterium]|nr:type II secretion system F family protein [Patescibacteria group bacterium]
MITFNYRVRDTSGNVKLGAIEAADLKIATETLQNRGYQIVGLEKVEKVGVIKSLENLMTRVSVKEIALLSEQLATMFDAGVPIVEALRIANKQTDNKKLKEALGKVSQDVEGGAKLSFALGQYPKIFNQYYVGMVRSGEASGQVSRNLNFLARQMKKTYELRSEIRGALMYPAFIVLGVVAVMLIAVFYVLPNMLSVIEEAGVEDLPWSTKVLMGFTDFMQSYWYIIVGILVAAGVGFYFFWKTEKGRKQFDMFLLKMPLFGKMIQKYYLAQFANSLSSLVAGGVPIVEAFQMVGDMMPNKVYQEIFHKTAEKVKGGSRIASVLSKKMVIPPMLSNMLSVGEETGKVDQILDKLADYYQTEVDNQVKGLVSLIEPIMMVVLGIGVGIIVSAVLLPMYNLASSF